MLLRDGQVLVFGGSSSSDAFDAGSQVTFLYDPAEDTWAPTGRMTKLRRSSAATLLSNGQVLVIGGDSSLRDVERYDPAKGEWVPTGGTFYSYTHQAKATLLLNGNVLVVKGNNEGSTAELYDPLTHAFSPTESIGPDLRPHVTATLLPDGQVLVTSSDEVDYTTAPTAARYDPVSNAWTSAVPMSTVRYNHTETLLSTGQVLAVGGFQHAVHDGFWKDTALASAERYLPAHDAWTLTPSMSAARMRHTATRLLNGQVLVTGGAEKEYSFESMSSAERFTDLGDPCNESIDCMSGFCSNSVCCSECACGTCDDSGRCQPTGKHLGEQCAPPSCADATHGSEAAWCVAGSGECPRGRTVDCVAYRCDEQAGECKRRCASIEDCARGYACDLKGHCVIPPPPDWGSAGACTAAPTEPSHAALRWLGALLLAALTRRLSRASARDPRGRPRAP
jgi:hypothetical protein